MSAILPVVDERGDAELISAVRAGDVDAYGELFRRHVEAARRLARQIVSGPDVDDLVSEAFAKVLGVLQRGGGPDLAFRAYLLTAVRRLHVDKVRAASRLQPTDDLTPFDPGVPFRDTAVEGFENATAARAFASLPERWQTVLWHTEVEGQKPADVALLLGMSANSVSALAYRAREGLRQAFLSMHAQQTEPEACRWTHEHLGAYIRNGISRRDASRVESHLEECRRCMAVYLELTEVNSNLAGILGPVVLGGAAAAYVASAGAVATKGGLLLLVDRARDAVTSHLPATTVAGLAVTAVVGGAVYLGTQGDSQPTASPGRPGTVTFENGSPSASPTGPVLQQGPVRPGAESTTGPGLLGRLSPASDTPAALGSNPGPAASQQPGAAPPAGPSRGPDQGPGEGPGDGPGDGPGGGPSQGPTQGPTHDPSQEPGQEPSSPPPPSEPAEQPPTMDLAVHATVRPARGAAHRVDVTVTGLTSGATATLVISSDGRAVKVTHDDRCDIVQLGQGSCRVTATPTTYSFLAVPVDNPVTMTFRVAPDGDAVETQPADNAASVVLTR